MHTDNARRLGLGCVDITCPGKRLSIVNNLWTHRLCATNIAPVNSYQIAFGRRVRQLRLAHGNTQEEVAHRAGIHVTYLSGIERGVRNPSLTSIRALADGLGVPVSELFVLDVCPPPPPQEDTNRR